MAGCCGCTCCSAILTYCAPYIPTCLSNLLQNLCGGGNGVNAACEIRDCGNLAQACNRLFCCNRITGSTLNFSDTNTVGASGSGGAQAAPSRIDNVEIVGGSQGSKDVNSNAFDVIRTAIQASNGSGVATPPIGDSHVVTVLTKESQESLV
jgi:hypothetical protein